MSACENAARDTLLIQAEHAIEALKKAGKTISTCESFTAGLCAAALGSVPGASSVFAGSLVTYATRLKISLDHVPADLIEEYGVVSAECAVSMAMHCRDILDTDYALSFTGNAGPDALEGKPAGRIFCALAGPSVLNTWQMQIDLPRNELRIQAVSRMLGELTSQLELDSKTAGVKESLVRNDFSEI